ncbi:hypothetical protein CABS01_05907, partial [Colletotrichum abscissum]|uniref:uncharacterized protein n=1 Tax=Colletotrichum abscissum TaxID=1671311 RepID=UPI0027D568E0
RTSTEYEDTRRVPLLELEAKPTANRQSGSHEDLLAATLPFLYKRRPPRSVVFSTEVHTTVIDRPGTMFDGEARSKRQLRWSFWRMDASARSVREKMRASQ